MNVPCWSWVRAAAVGEDEVEGFDEAAKDVRMDGARGWVGNETGCVEGDAESCSGLAKDRSAKLRVHLPGDPEGGSVELGTGRLLRRTDEMAVFKWRAIAGFERRRW